MPQIDSHTLSPTRILLLAILLLASTHAHAQEPTGGLINSSAVVVDTGLHRAFAVDASHDRVVIYDELTKQQTELSVGKSPIALAIDQPAHRVYVVNSGSGNVSVIDARTAQVIATLPTDHHPYAIAVNPQTHQVLVSNTYSNKLTIIDGTHLTSEQKPFGSKDAIAVDPLHGEAYLIGYEDPAITTLDLAQNTTRKLQARIHLWALAVDAEHRTVYATAIGDASLEAISTTDGDRHEIPVGNFPCTVALSEDGSRAYVVNREDETVSVVDTAKRTTIATIKVGKTPQAIALDPAHHRAFVANTAAGTISIIDTLTNQVERTLPAGPSPYSLAVDPTRGELFIANLDPAPFHHLTLP